MLLVHTLNRHLCAELTFTYFYKMLGEINRSILNVNLKKYSRRIQHLVVDLKSEFLIKIVKDFKL